MRREFSILFLITFVVFALQASQESELEFGKSLIFKIFLPVFLSVSSQSGQIQDPIKRRHEWIARHVEQLHGR